MPKDKTSEDKICLHRFSNLENLTQYAEIHPEQNETLLDRVFEQISLFKQIVPSGSSSLVRLAKIFSEHSAKLLDYVLNDKTLFTYYVENSGNLAELAQAFPTHSEKLLDYVFSIDENYFKALVKNSHDLAKLAKAFPTHSEKIRDYVFSIDEDHFKTLVKSNSDVNRLTSLFSKTKIVSLTVKDVMNTRKKYLLQKNPEGVGHSVHQFFQLKQGDQDENDAKSGLDKKVQMQ